MAKVRIRKAGPGEQAGYYNKTSKFLHKAQMGGAPSIEDLSYPTSNQSNTQMTDEQLASLVVNDISNSRPKEEIVVKLVNIYGKDPMEATSFVNQIYSALQDQQEVEQEEDEKIEEEQLKPEIDSGIIDEEEEVYDTDLNSQMADEIVNEEDVDVDDNQAVNKILMMNGGLVQAQDGISMNNPYPDYYSQYLPEQMFSATQPEYDSYQEETYPNMAAYPDQVYKQGGAYKKDKRAYVNSVLNLVKKQMGGADENGLTKKADQADPTGANVRKNILSNYVGTLKSQSQIALAKEQAEKEFDQMMQQQAMYNNQAGSMYEEGGVVDNPFSDQYGNLQRFVYGGNDMMDINQSDIDFTNSKDTTDGYLPEARRGRELRNLFPANMPSGYYTKYMGARDSQGKPIQPMQGFGFGPDTRIKSIDVHKTRLFSGAPKKYSITFTQGAVDPTKQNLITLPKEESVNKFSKKEIARGDRQPGRQRPWYANKKYEQDFEEYDLTPEELQKLEDLKLRDAKNRDAKRKQGLDILQMFNPKVGITPEEIEQYKNTLQNQSGLPDYNQSRNAELKRFIPKAEVGTNTPVTYNNNPIVLENKDATSVWADPFPSDKTLPTLETTGYKQPEQYTIDPNQPNRPDTLSTPGEDITLDFKTKRNIDGEALVNTFNAGVKGVTGFLNKRDQRNSQRKLSEELTSDNLYARTDARDRGDYVDYGSQLGQFQFDRMGQDRSAKYGGYMQEGGYTEGDEVDMTPEELEAFIANGGEVEYL